MNGTLVIAESIERSAWTDMFEAAPSATRSALGLAVSHLGGALALTARRVPHPLLNRALGVEPDPRDLRAVAEHYEALGIERYFIHVHRGQDDGAAADRAAADAGLTRYRRAWAKFLRGTAPAPAVSTDLELGPATADDVAAIGQLYCEVFDLPPSCAPMVEALVGRPGWDVYAARDDGRTVAFGLLYHAGGVGYLAGAGTAASHRQRGAQGALMAQRITRALALGCRWQATETGEAIAGDRQHSYRNMLRCGFEVVGIRDNYARADLRWDHGTNAA